MFAQCVQFVDNPPTQFKLGFSQIFRLKSSSVLPGRPLCAPSMLRCNNYVFARRSTRQKDANLANQPTNQPASQPDISTNPTSQAAQATQTPNPARQPASQPDIRPTQPLYYPIQACNRPHSHTANRPTSQPASHPSQTNQPTSPAIPATQQANQQRCQNGVKVQREDKRGER